MEFNIPLGIMCREDYLVEDRHAARIIGSGDVDVLSTPSMISFMELTAWRCVEKYLPKDYTTVGVKVCVEHKAPAPIGARVAVEAVLTNIAGRRLVFGVKAYWNNRVIGEGKHERYIVNREKFLAKLHKLATR